MESPASKRRAHFIGICGAGMSAVANLMRDSGWDVTGSDEGYYPPISDFLDREGLPCLTPHSATNIPKQVDLIVIGKHAKLTPETNDEVKEAFERRALGETEIKSFPEVLQSLTNTTRNIVVAGSYGKSTATALLAWMLRESGKDPSYFIGAVPLGFSSTAHIGAGAYFVLEGDEYPASNWDARSKFLFYNARAVLLTSGEYDHFNVFKTEQQYVDCYKQLVREIPESGLLVACADGKNVPEISAEARCRVVTYSAKSSDANWTACDRRFQGGKTKFTALSNGNPVSDFEMSLLGEHNVENALGAAAILLELAALASEEARKSLATFPGLRRRLESKASGASVTVYEDLSSSFPKATACLRAVRERHPKAEVTAVFQPHTFSFRSRKALEWYPGMFREANRVIVFSPPKLQGLASSEELSHDEILNAILSGNSCPVELAASSEDVVELLKPTLWPGDVVVLMTSGGMGGTIEAVAKIVKERFTGP